MAKKKKKALVHHYALDVSSTDKYLAKFVIQEAILCLCLSREITFEYFDKNMIQD
jgi:hypothetical protein